MSQSQSLESGLTRRSFLTAVSAFAIQSAAATVVSPHESTAAAFIARVDRLRVLQDAAAYLHEDPITITASHSDRSQGGLHDYFSEGDYWWPDPNNPDGPYIRRDGFSNPANFDDHRKALLRLSVQAPTLAAAWKLTRQRKYAAHFAKHLRAWFVDDATRMNPNLEYAQAIHGVTKGRGIGVIDTLQLVEVVRAARALEADGGLNKSDADQIRAWFAAYVTWMTTSKNGTDEEKEKNNHGTCWVLQVAEFSQFAHRAGSLQQALRARCIAHFKNDIVPTQIAKDGSLPLELARTKPYSYSLFDADVLAGICQSLSTPAENLWLYKGPNGAGVADTIAFYEPFIADKSKWPFAKDVEHFDVMPGRRPCILFAGIALHRPEYLRDWEHLDASSTDEELIRNLPIRQPLLWI